MFSKLAAIHTTSVRARAVAGDISLCAEFERVRLQTLTQPRDAEKLRADVISMRARMRAELDRSTAARFDLKQGEGGLVDLEFLLQFLVLRESAAKPALPALRDTPGLIGALEAEAVFDADTAARLRVAHAVLVDAGLRCTLDRRMRIVSPEKAIDDARAVVAAAGRGFGISPD